LLSCRQIVDIVREQLDAWAAAGQVELNSQAKGLSFEFSTRLLVKFRVSGQVPCGLQGGHTCVSRKLSCVALAKSDILVQPVEPQLVTVALLLLVMQQHASTRPLTHPPPPADMCVSPAICVTPQVPEEAKKELRRQFDDIFRALTAPAINLPGTK
jgi:hypothetical protein